MPLTSADKGKGKAVAPPEDVHESTSESESDSEIASSSNSSSSDSESEDSGDEITEEYLESLLEKARKRVIEKKKAGTVVVDETQSAEEDILMLGDAASEQQKLPPLDPGTTKSYITFGATRRDGPSSLQDPDAEQAEQSTSALVAPAPPLPPPELTRSGKPLTKKEKKALKNKTAGPDWFDLPAPADADLPRLYREVEALRLRNQLDPKRFYRKDEGEGKGIKGLPKHFAIGTIIPTSTPFGTASGDNLTRAERKRTLVDELVDDAEARRYAKKKFTDLQSVRAKKGRNTLHAKKAARKPKW
ncbi:Fcf2-domain-containing protein [Dentipellis sp. KUC8613]|nr:Fcf2-domain-containing protein [Dentipellis sp. KUC8613]